MALQIGDTAPDFEAQTTEGPISFHDWIGDSWAVLFSHPKDFTPVCTTELGYIAKIKPEFDRRGVKVVGLSVDSTGDHEGWAKDIEETQGQAPNYPIIGDADGGAPHLHFEVHPASLRYLGEDGAVNPTGYLQSWRRIQHVSAGPPVHPALPDGWAGQAAEQTFRELLAARPPLPRVARRLASLPASSGGIPPFLQGDLHPFGPPTASPEADSPPFAVITGVITVAAPAGVFHLRIGGGALRSSAPALPEPS
jgi:hypothetical protein